MRKLYVLIIFVFLIVISPSLSYADDPDCTTYPPTDCLGHTQSTNSCVDCGTGNNYIVTRSCVLQYDSYTGENKCVGGSFSFLCVNNPVCDAGTCHPSTCWRDGVCADSSYRYVDDCGGVDCSLTLRSECGDTSAPPPSGGGGSGACGCCDASDWDPVNGSVERNGIPGIQECCGSCRSYPDGSCKGDSACSGGGYNPDLSCPWDPNNPIGCVPAGSKSPYPPGTCTNNGASCTWDSNCPPGGTCFVPNNNKCCNGLIAESGAAICVCPAKCGDGYCQANKGETCSTCAPDCGFCPAVCGNGTCEAGESCLTCASDCGSCQATVQGTVYVDLTKSASYDPVGAICLPPVGIPDSFGIITNNITVSKSNPNVSVTDNTIDANGAYSVTVPYTYDANAVANGKGYVASIALDDTSYQLWCPASGTYPAFNVNSTTQTTGLTVTKNFFITDNSEPWFQALGGDILANNSSGGVSLSNQIPASCTGSCLPYTAARLNNVTNGSGIILYASGTQQLNQIDQDNRNYLAPTGYESKKEGYDYFYRQYELGFDPQNNSTINLNGLSNLPMPSVSNGASRYFFANGNTTISNSWNVNNAKKITIFVNGNLTINSNSTITVATDSFLAFVVKGSITFDSSIGNSSYGLSTAPIQGIYIADGSINIQSAGSNDKQFVGQGSFIGWGGVSLARNLNYATGGGNRTNPAEGFIYRPDLIINAPDEMKKAVTLWQEIAP